VSVLQFVVILTCIKPIFRVAVRVAVRVTVRDAVRCSALQCVAVRCSALECVAIFFDFDVH